MRACVRVCLILFKITVTRELQRAQEKAQGESSRRELKERAQGESSRSELKENAQGESLSRELKERAQEKEH